MSCKLWELVPACLLSKLSKTWYLSSEDATVVHREKQISSTIQDLHPPAEYDRCLSPAVATII